MSYTVIHGTNTRAMWIIRTIVFLLATQPCSFQYIVEVWEHKAGGFHAVLQCDATGADFGGEITMTSVTSNRTGCAFYTVPEDSCQDAYNPGANHTGCYSTFAVVPRGNCSFSEKAYHTQRGRPSPFSALIIYNDPGQAPVSMAGSKYADRITIPVVMVSHACMETMMGRFSAEKGFVVAIRAIPGYYDLVKYLIPMVAVIAFCFVVLCISLAIRVCRERRRLARKRLSKRSLNKIPVKKFQKGDKPGMCAVCLDDFIVGEKLRILPCSHAYHCKCIDPWLTKNRKVCPICKRKVLSTGESDSSDSDTERRASASATGSTTSRESAPLLRNAEPLASGRASGSDSTARGAVVEQDNRPPLRVVILRPSDLPPVPESSAERSAGVTLNQRLHSVANNVRNTLHSYYGRMIGRADSSTTNPDRAAILNSSIEEEPEQTRQCGNANDAFEEGSDTSQTENPSSSNMQQEDTRSVPKRRRHPASGKLTDTKLDLKTELQSEPEENIAPLPVSTSVPHLPIKDSKKSDGMHSDMKTSASLHAKFVTESSDDAFDSAEEELQLDRIDESGEGTSDTQVE